MQTKKKDAFDYVLEFIDQIALFGFIFIILTIVGSLVYTSYSSNLPATNQQLLDAKSKCPQIADYLPRTIATQSSLDFYVQKCEDEILISKQQSVLR